MELATQGAGWDACATVEDAGEVLRLTITAPSPDGAALTYTHVLSGRGHDAYLDLFAALSRRFGTRMPGSRAGLAAGQAEVPGLRELLTRNVSTDILYGYGDPAVLHVGDQYHLVVTSNDAPQSFPILSSRTLSDWQLSGFAFPQGAKPPWAAEDRFGAEYWAPEIHEVGDGYLLCFAAREPNGTLGIGLATGQVPTGAFHPDPEPVLRGGVVDPHLHVEERGCTLFWKEDSNDRWPGLLSGAIARDPVLAARLFVSPTDKRTARLAALIWPWVSTLAPMERFQAQQLLIEATVADFPAFRRRAQQLCSEGLLPEALLAGMRTTICAQPLSGARMLIDAPTVVLENDLPWEGHVVEGVWLWQGLDAYYLFYAANDFATVAYGIGVARGPTPLGPFAKQPLPLLRAANGWYGLGHPSVARAPDGRPHLFFHGYRPDAIGYKAFRALLTVPLRFEGGHVTVGD